LESTQLVDMQRVLSQLIESQTRITMLTAEREEYLFRRQLFPTAEHPLTAR
jgi:hypothetical protein